MVSKRRHAWLPDALVVLALLLLPLLFWWRLWTPNPADRATIPAGDFSSQYYPLQLFAARELADGRLPAWDPYLYGGQPGLADIQTGAFYPLNLVPGLILTALGWPWTLDLMAGQVIVHYMLASVFTYLFVRQLARLAGARPAAARLAGAVSALSFTYAGYLTSFPVQQLTILETAVWLPLVLFCLDRALSVARPAPAWPWLGGAALALACALLAGHPQTAMYVVYATLAYGLFLTFHLAERPPAGHGSRFTFYVSRFGLHIVLPLVVALALAAVQVVPTLQFIARSSRAGLGYDAVSTGSPLAEFTHLLYPGYFGGSPQYLGILTPILAAAALFAVRNPARRRVIFWLVAGAVALLLAFGGNTFLYNVTYLLVPGLSAVRNQERIIYLFSLAASVLAGYGALALVQPIARPLRKGFRHLARGLAWALVVMAVLTAPFYAGFLEGLQQDIAINMFEGVLRHHALILIVLAGAVVIFALRVAGQGRRWRVGLALGLIWLNLFTVNWRLNLAEPPADGVFASSGLVDYIRSQSTQPGTFRISSAGLLPGGPSAGVVYEIEDITGNTPLRLEAVQDMEERLGDWRRWQLLNVWYVLSRRDLAGPGLDQVYAEGKIKIYRVGDPLPRAWVVHQAVTTADDQALAALDAPDFDPRAVAVVPPGSRLAASLGAAAGPGEEARVVAARPGRLALDVALETPGILVISQPFYPGWRATVDGQPVSLERVDYALQGLALEPGAHRVELSFSLSLLPAAVGLAALAAVLAVLFVKRGSLFANCRR